MKKKYSTLFILASVSLLLTACTKDTNDWYNSYNGYSGFTPGNIPNNTGGSTGNLSDFNIAIDSTALEESENVPSDDKDYVENFKTTNTIEIKFSKSKENDILIFDPPKLIDVTYDENESGLRFKLSQPVNGLWVESIKSNGWGSVMGYDVDRFRFEYEYASVSLSVNSLNSAKRL